MIISTDSRKRKRSYCLSVCLSLAVCRKVVCGAAEGEQSSWRSGPGAEVQSEAPRHRRSAGQTLCLPRWSAGHTVSSNVHTRVCPGIAEVRGSFVEADICAFYLAADKTVWNCLTVLFWGGVAGMRWISRMVSTAVALTSNSWRTAVILIWLVYFLLLDCITP